MNAPKLRVICAAAATLLAVSALTACNTATETPGTGGTGEVAPFERGVVEPGSGEGMKIGYISLGDSIPFVKIVSDGIKEQAEIAGAELVFCDSQLDAAKALACASNFKAQGVQGIINFQSDEKAAPNICAAGPDVPVVAIDIKQEPCMVTFMGADNFLGGEIAGQALGDYFKENFDCEYDAIVSMDAPQSGEATLERAAGGISGFEKVCGTIPPEKLHAVDGKIAIDTARSVFADVLTSIPAAERIGVLSLNDDMMLGAFAAAKAQGREDQLWGSAMTADPTSFENIQNNEHWIGDSAWFPELYGATAVSAIIALIAGQEIPDKLLTEHVFIDKSNFADFYG